MSQERLIFPWEIDKIADEKHLYYLNDRVILLEKNLDPNRAITSTGDFDLEDPLLNPAQLWYSHNIDLDSKQGKFIKWLQSSEAASLIDKFSLPDVAPNKKLFIGLDPPRSFKKILKSYQKHIKNSENLIIDQEWNKPKPADEGRTTCSFL